MYKLHFVGENFVNILWKFVDILCEYCGWIFLNICVNILCKYVVGEYFSAHQSPSQADMLLDAKRLNLGLDKEAEVLQVSHLQF